MPSEALLIQTHGQEHHCQWYMSTHSNLHLRLKQVSWPAEARQGACNNLPEAYLCFKECIICYTVHPAHADVLAKVEHYLGGSLEEAPAVHNVRDVAPNKLMLCISFRVPRAVAFHGREQSQQQDSGRDANSGRDAKSASPIERSPLSKRPRVADP